VKEEKNISKNEVEKDNEKKEGWWDRRGSLRRKRSRSTWRRRR
jgi:2-polyprenyl-3-methyl-5-hydroxy-6-metoxy-1,4-benzoquinol methylase